MRVLLMTLLCLVMGCKNMDPDNDGFPDSVDCGNRIYHDYSDPEDPYDGIGMDGRDIYPNAPDEPYDGIDANCWGDSDYDADHDGFVSADYGGDDCGDFDPLVYPGAREHCDGVDNDCDGSVDEEPWSTSYGVVQFYWDYDGDGYAGDREAVWECTAPPGYYPEPGEDCDDADAGVHPRATEVCDDIDNDCNGTTDGAEAVDPSTWYFDYDGDVHAGDLITLQKCEGDLSETEAQYYVATPPDDCDDLTEEVSPDAEEVCDEIDNDCDSAVDEGLECLVE